MRVRFIHPHRGRRRGAAVLEFAFVAPLLFMVTMGLIEFGRTMMVQQILTNASREGARIGVVGDATTDDIIDMIEEYTADAFLSGVDVTVTPDPPSSAEFGEPVTVDVSVLFDQVSWLPAPWFLSGATLRATTSMRRESL